MEISTDKKSWNRKKKIFKTFRWIRFASKLEKWDFLGVFSITVSVTSDYISSNVKSRRWITKISLFANSIASKIQVVIDDWLTSTSIWKISSTKKNLKSKKKFVILLWFFLKKLLACRFFFNVNFSWLFKQIFREQSERPPKAHVSLS